MDAAQDGPQRFIGAVPDEYVMYSDVPADYTRLSPIGYGASSVVYQAVYHQKDDDGTVHDYPCALKVLNLDKLQPSALKLLTRETQLMSLSKVTHSQSTATAAVSNYLPSDSIQTCCVCVGHG